MSATILKVWRCEQIEDSSWLVADYRLRCSGPDGADPTWAGYAAFAGIAFVIYPLGIPLFYLYKLYKNKEGLYDEDHPKHESLAARYDFLYASYEPQAPTQRSPRCPCVR